MKRLLPLLLCTGALMSCQHQAENSQTRDLTTRVLFTANGSYDAQADNRGKVQDVVGVRRVEWRQHPPLEAQAVTVEYDSEQRTRGWQMTLEKPKFTLAELTAGAGQTVATNQGTGTLITTGPLGGVLVLPKSPDGFRVLTRGYAVQHAADLLPAFAGQ